MNLPNKIRLMWGRMENFKCVDYFQVEYFQRKNPAGTVQMTQRINRHRRSVEIEASIDDMMVARVRGVHEVCTQNLGIFDPLPNCTT